MQYLSLSIAISDVKHISHQYEITDHATSYFSIYFLPVNKGPGVFRAHPSLLKKNNYKNIIENTIVFTMLSDLTNKDSVF